MDSTSPKQQHGQTSSCQNPHNFIILPTPQNALTCFDTHSWKSGGNIDITNSKAHQLMESHASSGIPSFHPSYALIVPLWMVSHTLGPTSEVMACPLMWLPHAVSGC